MKTIILILLFCCCLFPQQFLKVTFNEPMDKETLKDLENYKINDEFFDYIDIAGIVIFEDQTEYIYLIIERLDPGKYVLKVENLKDVAGNLINKDKNFAYFEYIIKPDEIKQN